MKSGTLALITIVIMIIAIWGISEINKGTDKYLYGNSLYQNKILNTIRLHKLGITGKGVKVGLVDAGFYSAHPVFAETSIIKEYDFITNESTTANFNHNKGMDHGTNALSVMGAYKVNELIGVAYGADYLLAKTDINGDRLREEELIGVKGACWLADNKVNIISTSLSYNKFEDADYYKPEQMNGEVSILTKTADSLFKEGILFFCSAGNNFDKEWHIIEPPADGFNVVAVGSVDKKLSHSYFSSCGPTKDGRIKPDLVALGEKVWSARYIPNIEPKCFWNSGTSVAAPLAAGVAVLILSSHPNLKPEQVIEAIKMTSSNSELPDSLYGWGIPDAEKAVSYYGPAFSNEPIIKIDNNYFELSTYVFSSYGLEKKSVELHLYRNNGENEIVYNMKEVKRDLYSAVISSDEKQTKYKFYFTAKDKRGIESKYPTGILGEHFIFDN